MITESTHLLAAQLIIYAGLAQSKGHRVSAEQIQIHYILLNFPHRGDRCAIYISVCCYLILLDSPYEELVACNHFSAVTLVLCIKPGFCPSFTEV